MEGKETKFRENSKGKLQKHKIASDKKDGGKNLAIKVDTQYTFLALKTGATRTIGLTVMMHPCHG